MAEYSFYEFARRWPELQIAVGDAEAALRVAGRPVAADMVLKAYGLMQDELLVLARDMSVKGTEVLRETERKTRVRGDTGGEGGARLEDHLVVEPTAQQNLLPGSIGVNNLGEMDKNVPWWLTNEDGYTGFVGKRVLYGFFSGGGDDAPPAREEFRVHPLFTPGYSPVSGGGMIRNPIPKRRFVEKSIPIIERLWKAEFDAIRGRFDLAMERAKVTYR